MCPGLVDAVAATDADVIACYPYLFATTVDAIAVSRVPVVLHPAAHDEPALYFSAFRRSFRDVDGFVYHTRAERELMEDVYRIGARPQVVLGLGVNDPAGTGRPGGDVLGIGDRPYLCYLGRVDEHKGCGMLADYFAEYKERQPVGPGPRLRRAGVGQGAGASRHRGDRDGVRGRQVGHPGRRPGDGHPVGLRVVLAGRPRGVDARGPGAGQRVLCGHHGALPALGRRPVVRLLPELRGHGRPAGRRRRPAVAPWATPAGATPSGTTCGRRSSTGTPRSSRASSPGAAGRPLRTARLACRPGARPTCGRGWPGAG